MCKAFMIVAHLFCHVGMMPDTGITTSFTSAGDAGTGTSGMDYSGSRGMETGMETAGSEYSGTGTEYSGSRGMETGSMGHSSTGGGIAGGVATLRKVHPLTANAPPVLIRSVVPMLALMIRVRDWYAAEVVACQAVLRPLLCAEPRELIQGGLDHQHADGQHGKTATLRHGAPDPLTVEGHSVGHSTGTGIGAGSGMSTGTGMGTGMGTGTGAGVGAGVSE